MTQQEQEQLIIDFAHGQCKDKDGNPINMNCEQFWKNYQNELHAPGCRGCIRKKVNEKYSNLIKMAQDFAPQHPGERILI